MKTSINNLKFDLQSFYNLVESLEKIPAIGKRSAQKIAYILSVENKFLGLKVSDAIENATRLLRICAKCGMISENEICTICDDKSRENGELCIVMNPKDIFTIEGLNIFRGKYFVLGDELNTINFDILKERIINENIQEIIFAFSPSIANDSVALFIEDKLGAGYINYSKIAHGVPTGIGLDNIDQNSLISALHSRTKVM